MKAENFIVIQGWMRTELELKGNDLLVYAIIYGFSQTENQKFTGSLQYLADWCGATKQGIMKNLKNLLDRNLIVKEEHEFRGVKSVDYYTTQLHTPLNSVEHPIQLSCINNIEESKTDKIDRNNSKELLQNSNFQFGKVKKETKKDSLYTKCVSLIDDFVSKHNCGNVVRNKLIEYLNYRISVKEKPLYTNIWKSILSKLDNLHQEGHEYVSVIDYCLERGYLSFYAPNNSRSSIRSESGTRHVPRMTQQDYEDEAEQLAQLEERGVQVRF